MFHKILLFVVGWQAVIAGILDYQPQQVHIAFGENVSEVVVTWSTTNVTNETFVEYGIGDYTAIAKGYSTKFVDGGAGRRAQYIHRVTLRNLKPTAHYIYHCGSNQGWSPEFWFKTPPIDSDWSPHVAIFGDMGNENAQALAYLQEEAQRKVYDAIVHVGDFAYDMDSYNAMTGDQFMRQIEPLAAYVPYMVCAGNHEEKYNFSNYRARFSMPGGTENLMYSFNLGPVHFIGFTTEAYYFTRYGIKTLVKQYEWLEQDLIEANKPENRQERPWIVTFGHRPMYCSNDNGDDCSYMETITRVGIPLTHWFGLEELFYKYGVDVEIWAHEHSYERLWPIYNYKVLNGSWDRPYTNPRGPVHIVTGSAGCKEGREPFFKVIPKWSAFHSQDYGYTRLKAENKTHIHFEQVSVDKKGSLIDAIWIVKDEKAVYGRKNWADRHHTEL